MSNPKFDFSTVIKTSIPSITKLLGLMATTRGAGGELFSNYFYKYFA